MAIRLVLYQGDQKLAVELADGVYTIGRDDKAEVILPNPTVSSRHAEIEVDGSKVSIRDLGSSNGTFVNDQRLDPNKKIVVSEADDVRLGSASIMIAPPKGSPGAAPPPKTEKMGAAAAPAAAEPPPLQQVAEPEVEKKPSRARAAAARIPWTVRYWMAGAIAILVLAFLFVIISAFTESQVSRNRRLARFIALASQYSHVLEDQSLTRVPAPNLDESIGEPVRVIDRQGRQLYPESTDEETGQPPLFTPLIDPESRKVQEKFKVGLSSIMVPVKGGSPVQAYAYPIRSAGDLRGYVVARPVAGRGNLGSMLGMAAVATLIALIVLYFALQPNHARIRNSIEAVSSKLSPVAAGFMDSLPRSGAIAEMDQLADEAEKVLKSRKGGGGTDEKTGGRKAGDQDRFLAPLIKSAQMLYCFIGTDFEILSITPELKELKEFSGARIGESIFDAGLSNVQSKQMVQGITDSRSAENGRTRLTLTSDGSPTLYDVWVKQFNDKESGGQLFGLLFRPSEGE